MNHASPVRGRGRKATNLLLDEAVVKDARELGLNLSQVCEQGLKKAVADERGRRWLEENAEAIAEFNEWVANNDLPLADLRQF
jgi:antitoxin CcdA